MHIYKKKVKLITHKPYLLKKTDYRIINLEINHLTIDKFLDIIKIFDINKYLVFIDIDDCGHPEVIANFHKLITSKKLKHKLVKENKGELFILINDYQILEKILKNIEFNINDIIISSVDENNQLQCLEKLDYKVLTMKETKETRFVYSAYQGYYHIAIDSKNYNMKEICNKILNIL